MEDEVEMKNIEKEKNAQNNEDLINNFDISCISQSLANEQEILNKLQRDISEYTNYDNIQNPYNFKSWWDTLSSSKEAPMSIRRKIYQVSLHYLPGSYKLWYHYLKEEREYVKSNYNLPNKHYDEVNKLHEQALIYMMKMPIIWIDYIQFMIEQNSITKTKIIFNKALRVIPITQHKKLWDIYIPWIESLPGCYKSKIEIFNRYIKFNSDYKEKFINFLIGIKEFNLAIHLIIEILNDENFYSKENKSQYYYWILLCQIINNYPEDLNFSKYNKDLNVDKVIRHGINKYTDEVGNLWVTLANYYIKIGLIEKAREIFEEALEKILTVRDFSLIFNSYLNFEQEMMKQNLFNNNSDIDNIDDIPNIQENQNLDELELTELDKAFDNLKIKEVECNKKKEKEEKENLFENKQENNTSLQKFNFIRVNNLLQRRPFLLNSTILRRNPNNVSEWLKRIELMKEKKDFNLTKKLYEESLSTIKINEAYGKLSELYISYAAFYEENNNIKKANEIYYKGCNLNFKNTEENVNMWCLWCEMNIRQKRYQDAYNIIKYICTNNVNKYYKYNKNIKLWSLYVDLEMNLNENNERQVIYIYNKMIEYKIANIETIFNFIIYLEKIKNYEKIYNIYEQSLELFSWPNVYDICICYLVDFINNYKGEKIEIFRDIVQNIITLSGHQKIFYYIYAFFEEKYGLYNHCIEILKEAAKNVKEEEKPEIHSVIIAKSAKYFGIGKDLGLDEEPEELDFEDDDIDLEVLKKYKCSDILSIIEDGFTPAAVDKKDISQFSDFKDAYYYVPYLLHNCGMTDIDYSFFAV